MQQNEPFRASGRRRGSLGEAWLVLVLAMVFGATLAGVHVGLRDRIETPLLDVSRRELRRFDQHLCWVIRLHFRFPFPMQTLRPASQ